MSPYITRHRPCFPRVPPLRNLDTHAYALKPLIPRFDPPPHVTSICPNLLANTHPPSPQPSPPHHLHIYLRLYLRLCLHPYLPPPLFL
ncbi:hypothetical protein AOQ84DRAFT_62277 [Glonium stellatum]|uniref:Uncharacterized protein n=1 Tax=Glonium stellatum TaxID=574774 RepID=A0A8E2EYJ0_9PEZI|nr:hypothetical protein AOQ84DRAFT_62277 [Glonium stellatum]